MSKQRYYSRRPKAITEDVLCQAMFSSGVMVVTLVDTQVAHEGCGPDITLQIFNSGRGVEINVSDFTAEEFEAFEYVINRAISLGKEIALARDKVAKEHAIRYADGDPTARLFERVYRALPGTFRADGTREIDSQELLQRPVNVPIEPESESSER